MRFSYTSRCLYSRVVVESVQQAGRSGIGQHAGLPHYASLLFALAPCCEPVLGMYEMIKHSLA